MMDSGWIELGVKITRCFSPKVKHKVGMGRGGVTLSKVLQELRRRIAKDGERKSRAGTG